MTQRFREKGAHMLLYETFGLVDLDYRTEEAVNTLQEKHTRVAVLKGLHSVECFFLSRPIWNRLDFPEDVRSDVLRMLGEAWKRDPITRFRKKLINCALDARTRAITPGKKKSLPEEETQPKQDGNRSEKVYTTAPSADCDPTDPLFQLHKLMGLVCSGEADVAIWSRIPALIQGHVLEEIIGILLWIAVCLI
jgi:hypothetical protein